MDPISDLLPLLFAAPLALLLAALTAGVMPVFLRRRGKQPWVPTLTDGLDRDPDPFQRMQAAMHRAAMAVIEAWNTVRSRRRGVHLHEVLNAGDAFDDARASLKALRQHLRPTHTLATALESAREAATVVYLVEKGERPYVMPDRALNELAMAWRTLEHAVESCPDDPSTPAVLELEAVSEETRMWMERVGASTALKVRHHQHPAAADWVEDADLRERVRTFREAVPDTLDRFSLPHLMRGVHAAREIANHGPPDVQRLRVHTGQVLEEWARIQRRLDALDASVDALERAAKAEGLEQDALHQALELYRRAMPQGALMFPAPLFGEEPGLGLLLTSAAVGLVSLVGLLGLFAVFLPRVGI